jgi:hypothetical protein
MSDDESENTVAGWESPYEKPTEPMLDIVELKQQLREQRRAAEAAAREAAAREAAARQQELEADGAQTQRQPPPAGIQLSVSAREQALWDQATRLTDVRQLESPPSEPATLASEGEQTAVSGGLPALLDVWVVVGADGRPRVARNRPRGEAAVRAWPARLLMTTPDGSQALQQALLHDDDSEQ